MINNKWLKKRFSIIFSQVQECVFDEFEDFLGSEFSSNDCFEETENFYRNKVYAHHSFQQVLVFFRSISLLFFILQFSGHYAAFLHYDGKPQLNSESNNLCILVSRLSKNFTATI